MTTLDDHRLLEAEIGKPNTGYMLVSPEFMAEEECANFLFDHFEFVGVATTLEDEQKNVSRIVLRSEHFKSGYGQYSLYLTSRGGGPLELSRVVKV